MVDVLGVARPVVGSIIGSAREPVFAEYIANAIRKINIKMNLVCLNWCDLLSVIESEVADSYPGNPGLCAGLGGFSSLSVFNHLIQNARRPCAVPSINRLCACVDASTDRPTPEQTQKDIP